MPPQLYHILSSIIFKPEGIDNEPLKPVQLLNAPLPIAVTVEGSVKGPVKPLQSLNALLSILSNPKGRSKGPIMVEQNENAASVFQQMRENLASQIVEFIKELVLPDVVKVSRSEHVLKFMGDMKDLEKFDRLFTNQISQQTAYKYLSKTGFYPEKSSIMKLEETVSKKLKDSGLFRSVKIPAGFFSNISDVDIMMDNESRDIPLQTQNLQTLIGMIMPNPQALDNPLIKSIIYAYSELLGISPVELELAQNEQNQNANLQTTQGRLPQVNPEQGLATGQRTSQPILR